MTSADLIYDEASHTTATPDGRDVPHVTAVLKATGLAEDLDRPMPRRARAAIDFGRDRGTAAHADCHAYDDGDLLWETVDPAVLPYVEAWMAFRTEFVLVPAARGRERRFFHDTLFYTGIIDGVFILPSGRRVLIDMKTGAPGAARYQTAAYALGWDRENPELPIHERWAVQLCPSLGYAPGWRGVPYRVIPYEDPEDFDVWRAALCVYNHQPARRDR